MSSEIAIRAENLQKSYCIYSRPLDRLKQSLCKNRKYYHETEALKGVSFEVRRGETLGIVGRNGSGKSTLLQLLCGTLMPSSGTVETNGRISALLELGAGFNPEFTGRENVHINAAILGLSPQEIAARYDDIVAFSGIGDAVERPVKTYSSGMYVRLAFAVAVASDPDILIVDEALAVGDEAFQRKCFARIRAIQERGGTILFVSHAASSIVELCSRAILLDEGELLLSGTPKSVIAQYHKLAFAPADQLSAIRADIREGRHHEEGEAQSFEPSAQFDPALMPESRVAYASHGAEIRGPKLTDVEGNPVNLLEQRGRYRFSYEVAFGKDARNVRAGMMIKTRKGTELGGASTTPETGGIPLVKAGQVLRVAFEFESLLAPDAYFINCGVSGEVSSGGRTFLHRIVDAVMFKVLPDSGRTATGMVDFLAVPEVDVEG